jgi:hypothetical protein
MDGWGEVAQIICTHASQCKNDKRKLKFKKIQAILKKKEGGSKTEIALHLKGHPTCQKTYKNIQFYW